MKTWTPLIILLSALGATLPAVSQTRSFTNSPMNAVPMPIDMGRESKAKQLVSNRVVRAYRVDLQPGEATSVDRHEHDFLVISLGDSRFEFAGTANAYAMTMSDGEVQVMKGRWPHRIVNKSQKSLHLVEVEVEREIAPERAICGLNGQSCSGAKFAVNDDTNYVESRLFETPSVRIEKVEIAPGKGMPEHGHREDHLMVALNDQQVSNAVVAGDILEMISHAGDASWMSGGIVHRIVNHGSAPARFLTIECK